MVNKIGDYIHYNHYNYLRFGLTTDQPNKPNIFTILDQEKKRILLEAKKQNSLSRDYGKALDIENKLNYFTARTSLENVSWDTSKIEQAIGRAVENRINTLATSVGGAYALGFRVDKGNLRNKLSEKGSNRISSINARLVLLKAALDQSKNTIKANKTIESLKTALMSLENTWKTICNDFGLDLDQLSTNNNMITLNSINSNFIKDLNALWKQFLGSNAAYIEGEVTELYAAICQDLVNNKINALTDEVINYLDKVISNSSLKSNKDLGLMGKERSQSVLTKQFFSVTGKAELDQFTTFTGGEYKIKAPTQDKVDLIIKLDDLNIPASIKSHNFDAATKYNNIKLHSGRSILSLTQQYTNFMNHYLNITSESFGDPENEGNNGAMDPYIKYANQILKFIMGFKALAGGIYKISNGEVGPNASAELFIVKNQATQRYTVYFIEDILKRIEDNINLLNIKGINDQTTWLNQWSEGEKNHQTARSRINNLLQQLHTFQLDISIKQELFKN